MPNSQQSCSTRFSCPCGICDGAIIGRFGCPCYEKGDKLPPSLIVPNAPAVPGHLGSGDTTASPREARAAWLVGACYLRAAVRTAVSPPSRRDFPTGPRPSEFLGSSTGRRQQPSAAFRRPHGSMPCSAGILGKSEAALCGDNHATAGPELVS